MRKLLGLAVAGFFALSAGTASAGTLPFGGFVAFGLATLPSIVITGASGALINGSGGLGHINTLAKGPNVFGPGTASLPVTANMTVQSVRFTNLADLSGSFASLSGGPPGGGPMGLFGRARVCVIFKSCAAAVNVPLTPAGTFPNLVGFGVGGTQIVTGTIGITLQHNPWTSGSVFMTIHEPTTTVTTPALPGGFAHDAASLTSNTAAGSGTLQLVSVSKAFTSLTAAFPELPVFAIMNIHFVPEPGTLLLLGSGVAGLAILGRSRRKNR